MDSNSIDSSGIGWISKFTWRLVSWLPDRLVWACLVRALAEWEPENEWIMDRSSLAAWALVDYWGRRIEDEVGHEYTERLPPM